MTTEKLITRHNWAQTGAMVLTLFGTVAVAARYVGNVEATNKAEHDARIVAEQVLASQIKQEADARLAADLALMKGLKECQDRQETVAVRLERVATILEAIDKRHSLEDRKR